MSRMSMSMKCPKIFRAFSKCPKIFQNVSKFNQNVSKSKMAPFLNDCRPCVLMSRKCRIKIFNFFFQLFAFDVRRNSVASLFPARSFVRHCLSREITVVFRRCWLHNYVDSANYDRRDCAKHRLERN